MADVRINPQRVTPNSITPAYTSPLLTTDTYLVRNTGRMMLHFKKTGVGAATITIQTPVKLADLDLAEQAVTVPATTGDKMIGPFPPAVFSDASQDVRFTASDVAGLSVAAVEIG